LAETSFKTLIERFRSRPEWQHPDPAVRAEAVLRLPASDHELVLALAREDEDPHVRRAAVKRLSEVAVLAEIAGSDADAHVREEAAGRLVHVALNEHDESQARAAVAGLMLTTLDVISTALALFAFMKAMVSCQPCRKARTACGRLAITSSRTKKTWVMK